MYSTNQRGLLNAFASHVKSWRSEPGALEQHVEVNPFEHQLGNVVHLSVFQKTEWTYRWQRIVSGEWLSVVVEIDDVGFPEA
ncbi:MULTISPECIES: hypothetical protein [Desulfosediminicola]|uniref:hypothetical protein n=1 Tax=Desulfosediminicola TaxID=2886823 RepID=UPI001C3D51FA|nr:hypothetical protein [Desulfosediminicola ganghwensis]